MKSVSALPVIVIVYKSVLPDDNPNGSGVSKENQDKIFEPKFTTKSSGMGLGLAMVKNIVETYKGNITFVTQENTGTTFSVLFPKG